MFNEIAWLWVVLGICGCGITHGADVYVDGGTGHALMDAQLTETGSNLATDAGTLQPTADGGVADAGPLTCFEYYQNSLLEAGCAEGHVPDCTPHEFAEIPCCSATLSCRGGGGYSWDVTCNDSCAQSPELLTNETDCTIYGAYWSEDHCIWPTKE